MSLERFDGAVAAESADVNTHVRAAGGKGSVVLPVHVESRGCREAKGGGVRERVKHRHLAGVQRINSPDSGSHSRVEKPDNVIKQQLAVLTQPRSIIDPEVCHLYLQG